MTSLYREIYSDKYTVVERHEITNEVRTRSLGYERKLLDKYDKYIKKYGDKAFKNINKIIKYILSERENERENNSSQHHS